MYYICMILSANLIECHYYDYGIYLKQEILINNNNFFFLLNIILILISIDVYCK